MRQQDSHVRQLLSTLSESTLSEMRGFAVDEHIDPDAFVQEQCERVVEKLAGTRDEGRRLSDRHTVVGSDLKWEWHDRSEYTVECHGHVQSGLCDGIYGLVGEVAVEVGSKRIRVILSHRFITHPFWQYVRNQQGTVQRQQQKQRRRERSRESRRMQRGREAAS